MNTGKAKSISARSISARSMSAAPRLRLIHVDCFEQPFRLRMPFRFGAVTVTHGQQAIIRARIRLIDGREADGYAAEALGAKWFDKNPALSDEQNLHQLRYALESAILMYRDANSTAGFVGGSVAGSIAGSDAGSDAGSNAGSNAGSIAGSISGSIAGSISEAGHTAFELFARVHDSHLRHCAEMGLPALVASFGPALLDRAILDALCRLFGMSFWQAMRLNLPGFDARRVATDLSDFDSQNFLRSLTPLLAVHARHTVGLVDPITAADQPGGSRVDDGLPETLEEVIKQYGNRYFKLKLSGQLEADLARLRRIALVLDAIDEPYHVTLDGNEQYGEVAAIVELWEAVLRDRALERLVESTLFIEQPLKRQVALEQDIDALARHKPVIIDESDGDLSAFVQARRLGYRGVSSKACKGFYKSLINLARCRQWSQGGAQFFLSGEDLTTQAGLSVQQDLALVSLLGISHVERNGHHFIDGFGERPPLEAKRFVDAHPELYGTDTGRPRLRINSGILSLASLNCPGFGTSVEPLLEDTAVMPPAIWPTPRN